MIGANAIKFIADARELTKPTRMMVSLSCTPPEFGACPETNADLVSTYGAYSISYRFHRRNGKLYEEQPKKFSIRIDFGLGYIKCKSYYDLCEQSKTNDHAKFILEMTNISEDMFEIAYQNEGMQIPFCFDVIKYNNIIRKKLGIEDETKYAMVFNPFKPFMGAVWKDNEDGSSSFYDKRRVKSECD